MKEWIRELSIVPGEQRPWDGCHGGFRKSGVCGQGMMGAAEEGLYDRVRPRAAATVGLGRLSA